MMNLDEKKGSSPHGISPLMLRKIFRDVKAPLTFIFNPSLAFGVISALCKESYIVPLHKTGDNKECLFCWLFRIFLNRQNCTNYSTHDLWSTA
jgi:hypothetical protein